MSLSPEQLELRRHAIGASEIAALAGLSRWSTPIAIYEAKRAGVLLEESLAMELGNLLEEPVAQLYARRTERILRRCYTLQRADRPFAVATPDRAAWYVPPETEEEVKEVADLAGADRLVQIKTTGWRQAREWGQPGTDEVPEDYLGQVTWEMGVSGVALADLAVLFDRDRFDVWTVHFLPVLFDGLYEIAARFMVDHVQAGKPPPPDASERYSEYLARAFPTHTNERLPIVDDPELALALTQYRLLKLIEKRTTSALRLRRNKLTAAIGLNAGFTIPDVGGVTWKRARDGYGVDWHAAAEAMRRLASNLLQQFGGQLEDGAQLYDQVLELESRYRCVTRKGTRRLNVRSPPEWAARQNLAAAIPLLEELAEESPSDTETEAE